MTYLLLSPLYFRIAANLSNSMLTTISPLRGQGVSKYDNKFLPQLNFIGSVHFNASDRIFFGKIEGINDLVTFEGSTVNELEDAFNIWLRNISKMIN